MSARSREGDWVTSIEAGDEADARGTIRRLVLAALDANPHGLIDDELLDEVNFRRRARGENLVPVSSVSKRRGELVEKGLVEPTDDRRESRWGRTQVVWRAVEA